MRLNDKIILTLIYELSSLLPLSLCLTIEEFKCIGHHRQRRNPLTSAVCVFEMTDNY